MGVWVVCAWVWAWACYLFVYCLLIFFQDSHDILFLFNGMLFLEVVIFPKVQQVQKVLFPSFSRATVC